MGNQKRTQTASKAQKNDRQKQKLPGDTQKGKNPRSRQPAKPCKGQQQKKSEDTRPGKCDLGEVSGKKVILKRCPKWISKIPANHRGGKEG